MAIIFDIKTKRFRKNGRFISTTIGMKSSTARKQFNKFKKDVPRKTVIGNVTIEPLKLRKKTFKGVTNIPGDRREFVNDLRAEHVGEKDAYTKKSIVRSLTSMFRGTTQTSYKYLYKDKKELHEKTKKVDIHYRLTDENGVTTIRSVRRHRKKARTPKQWSEFIESDFHNVMVNRIAPNTPSLDGLKFDAVLIGFKQVKD